MCVVYKKNDFSHCYLSSKRKPSKKQTEIDKIKSVVACDVHFFQVVFPLTIFPLRECCFPFQQGKLNFFEITLKKHKKKQNNTVYRRLCFPFFARLGPFYLIFAKVFFLILWVSYLISLSLSFFFVSFLVEGFVIRATKGCVIYHPVVSSLVCPCVCLRCVRVCLSARD